MNILKGEINIVKELPPHLRSLDIEAIGSLVCYLLDLDKILLRISFTHFLRAF